EDGTKEKISEFLELAESNSDEIIDFNNNIFKGAPGKESIQNAITAYLDEAEENSEKIETLLTNNDKKIKDLQRFYTLVYGEEDSDGKRSGGLQKEINERINDLD